MKINKHTYSKLILFFSAILVVIMAMAFHKPQKLIQAAQPNILLVIADDWSWPHASIYGDSVVSTPNFDWLAKEGALFNNAYCASPSCTPSRAALLTGQYPHRLAEGANLWGTLPKKYPNYVDMLEENGYYVGHERKGWAPGDYKAGGYSRNPAGPEFKSFAQFMESKPSGKPFCFWFGSRKPHREYDKGSGKNAGLNPLKIKVPGAMPAIAEVKEDMLDYYYEVQLLDRELGELIELLEGQGELENTLIVVTSDNGMPFPRAKATLYDWGTHMPMAIYWKGKIKPGQVIADFVNLVDLAPTFLDVAGQDVPAEMSGHSLLPVIVENKKVSARDKVFLKEKGMLMYVKAI